MPYPFLKESDFLSEWKIQKSDQNHLENISISVPCKFDLKESIANNAIFFRCKILYGMISGRRRGFRRTTRMDDVFRSRQCHISATQNEILKKQVTSHVRCFDFKILGKFGNASCQSTFSCQACVVELFWIAFLSMVSTGNEPCECCFGIIQSE